MIISRTPYRVSLFGGGSDYPDWYLKNGGSVFGFAIDKYCYILMRRLPPFFEHQTRIVYSKIELVNDVADIQHPIVRAVLERYGDGNGFEIHHDGDLPARSGLGSSSSFAVGILNALHAFQGRMTSKKDLACEAINIEQTILQENVGSQDQVWAAYGGMNRIDFHRENGFEVTPIVMKAHRRKELMGSLQLYFTGRTRFSSNIAAKQIANLSERSTQIKRMMGLVDEAVTIVQDESRPISDIGHLLHESWMLKRELADNITTDDIDDIYDRARKAGALGGKVIGAGGGGFILLYVEPDKSAGVRQELSDLINVQFNVDTSGSKIVVYEPDGLEQA